MITSNSESNYDLFDDIMGTTITAGTGIGVGGIWGTGMGVGGSPLTTSPGTIYNTHPGQTLTWHNTNTVWNNTTLNTPLKVKGDAEIDGDIKIKGKSLSEAIENIEKRLAILHPNEKLEEKWEELKALGERYRELEKDILEKEEIWKILKK